MGNVDARRKMNGNGWAVVAYLFVDDTVLFAQMRVKRNFQVVDEFYSKCTRRKWKVNDGKSKVMVFERRK